MIEVEDMLEGEIDALLDAQAYGHLGCAEDGQPYIVPVHFVYEKPNVYVYTTEGKKVEMIRENPKVCLQVEDVKDNENWRSVIVFGAAAQVLDREERDRAVELIGKRNPTLTPAVSIRWMDSWVRENIEVILKIEPSRRTGRASVDRSASRTPFVPTPGDKPPQIN